MADISQAIFQSIETIVNTLTETLKYDKMIVGTVDYLQNEETGEYVVIYEGNQIIAYSQGQTFENGESVYIRVPQGDFSNTKIIERKSSSKTQIDNMFETRKVDTVLLTEKEVSSGPITKGTGYKVIVNKNNPIQFSNKAKFLKLEAEFKFENGEFPTTEGNYGINIVFRDGTDKGALHSVTLDMNNFSGKPYGFLSWSPQYVNITLPQEIIKEVVECNLFWEKFDKNQNLGQNISVKEVKLTSYELVDLGQFENYFTLTSTLGIDVAELKADLKVRGQLIHKM